MKLEWTLIAMVVEVANIKEWKPIVESREYI